MKSKQFAQITLFLLLLTAVIVACSPKAETVEVEVTRVVAEAVEVEGETVEITVVVTETEIYLFTAEIFSERELGVSSHKAH